MKALIIGTGGVGESIAAIAARRDPGGELFERRHGDIERLTNSIAFLEGLATHQTLPIARQAALEKYRVDLTAARSKLSADHDELEELKEQLTHCDQHHLQCKEVLHPGAHISIGKARLDVKDTMRACKLVQFDGAVVDAITVNAAARSPFSRPPSSRQIP